MAPVNPLVEERKAIPSHSTATSDDPWDGPAQEAKLSNDAGASTYRKAYAWADPDKDPDTKAAYKFIHHFVDGSGSVGAASTRGCSTGIGVLNGGRGGSSIPDEDRQGVYNHLAKHLRDAKQEPPPLASAPAEPERRYERVTRYVSGAAWAMHPSTIAAVVAIIGERRSGHRPTAQEIRARIGQRERRAAIEPPAGVAVIPIVGPIAPKAEMVADVSSPATTSVEGFQARFRGALADPDVATIVLDVDSPGGSVDLVPEMAAEIFDARGTKPIVAVANTWAASAAYWLASAADRLVVTPSGEVGSVGVYSVHEDLSAAMAQKGIKHTFISAGDYKVEGNPFEPLSPEARAEMQAKVDAYYRMFVAAVAAHRGVSEATVEETFGQGRMVMATDAVARGMADEVGTLDDVLVRSTAPARSAPIVISGRRHRDPPEGAPPLVKRLLRFERELRATPHGVLGPVQVRESDGGITVAGYAALFGHRYEVIDALGRYEEEVLSGAFTQTLRAGADVRYLLNHEGLPLARTKSGTLVLEQDEIGLHYEARDLDVSDPDVQRLVPKLRRGDLGESSFSFQAVRQIWDEGYTHRQLAEVILFDVSTVTWAASPLTSSGLRGADLIRGLADVDPDELLVQVRSADAAGMHDALERARGVIELALAAAFDEPGRDRPSTMTLDMARRHRDALRVRGR